MASLTLGGPSSKQTNGKENQAGGKKVRLSAEVYLPSARASDREDESDSRHDEKLPNAAVTFQNHFFNLAGCN